MNFKRILFPTDFSEQSHAALDYASQLAAICQAELHIVYVHDSRDAAAVSGDASTYSCVLSEIDRRELQDRLTSQQPVTDVHCVHHFVKGVPADEILALAEEAGMDLIVMSSHGRSGLMRVLMGSVAENVVRHAKCPVLIVKQPSESAEHPQRTRTDCCHA